MKAISLTYQRNGISGEGFYQFIYKNQERGMRNEMTFVATFRVVEDGLKPDEYPYIDPVSCRVTSIDDPSLAWRGDRIAGDIENFLYGAYGKPENINGVGFYSLIDRVNIIK